ncbi:hypothetical protein ABPG77_002683 [Micractinium sp. CCAP 211/92]
MAWRAQRSSIKGEVKMLESLSVSVAAVLKGEEVGTAEGSRCSALGSSWYLVDGRLTPFHGTVRFLRDGYSSVVLPLLTTAASALVAAARAAVTVAAVPVRLQSYMYSWQCATSPQSVPNGPCERPQPACLPACRISHFCDECLAVFIHSFDHNLNSA